MSPLAALSLSAYDAAGQWASRRSVEALLNCYCREVARPTGRVTIRSLPVGPPVLHVELARLGLTLLARVSHASLTGHHRFLSECHLRAGNGAPSVPLVWDDVLSLLARELAFEEGGAAHPDFHAQVADSFRVLRAIGSHAHVAPQRSRSANDRYIHSEQALVAGHPFHPSPKSRIGFSDADLVAYGPEWGARFALHWFGVAPEALVHDALGDRATPELLGADGPFSAGELRGLVPVPVHPWQAKRLLACPTVGRAIGGGLVRDLGRRGRRFLATSSVRTVFHPESAFFYKLSLGVRITNCLRRNALPEMQAALHVARVLTPLLPALEARAPGFRALREIAFATVDDRRAGADERRRLQEGFGVLLRENVTGLRARGVTPLLAATVFSDLVPVAPRPWASAPCEWLGRYLDMLLGATLPALFEHGIMFEAHLQNVVVGLDREGRPAQLFLRDFDNCKLVTEGPARRSADSLPPRAREEILYPRADAWKRFEYCLFVNNIDAAIASVAAGDARREKKLWREVGDRIAAYDRDFGTRSSRAALRAWLRGQPFHAKNNLRTRFHKTPDRDARYSPVPNPLAVGSGELGRGLRAGSRFWPGGRDVRLAR